MAIKIIQHGTINTYTVTCPYCGCLFTCDDSDLHTRFSWTVATTSTLRNAVYCPECKQECSVRSVKLKVVE